jgi:hypothetical protein
VAACAGGDRAVAAGARVTRTSTPRTNAQAFVTKRRRHSQAAQHRHFPDKGTPVVRRVRKATGLQ